MLPPNFKRATARQNKYKAGVEENGNFNRNDDAANYGMPKTNVPRGRPSRKSSPPAVGSGLAENMGRLKIDGDGEEPYLFDCGVPVFTKKYCKNSIEKLEVEFLLSPYYEFFPNMSFQRTGSR
jgi:hypothetical protein